MTLNAPRDIILHIFSFALAVCDICCKEHVASDILNGCVAYCICKDGSVKTTVYGTVCASCVLSTTYAQGPVRFMIL